MALANAKQVEDLADRLTACADAAHQRLMKAIKNGEVDNAQAQRLFNDETALRQRANSLYIDAARCVIADLRESQAALLQTVDSAEAKLKRVKQIARFIDLVADLVILAAAAYAGKPGPVIAALKEIKEDVDALQAT